MLKPHVILSWSREHVARHGFECDQCGARIEWGTPYIRRVVARGQRLEVEREHSTQCAPAYQGPGI